MFRKKENLYSRCFSSSTIRIAELTTYHYPEGQNRSVAGGRKHRQSHKNLTNITADDPTKPLNFMEERIKYVYEHPETLVDIEFYNRSNILKNIWVEPTCISIDLESDTEYKIVTHDRFFRMEFDENNQVIFYLQHSFGFKLYKRPASKEVINQNEWILDNDCSDIN
jgi:hypothetical protein